ncbi:hypothetical protein [Metabacillus sp. FJAT-53654]|uniref:Uncharacterized protein n=1 Tax=Metabacillus rhizosphaerae TaxID=3117747 RepID=A0ABZ2MPJ8_9BACI
MKKVAKKGYVGVVGFDVLIRGEDYKIPVSILLYLPRLVQNKANEDKMNPIIQFKFIRCHEG